MKNNKRITSKEFLAKLNYEVMPELSFDKFIDYMRKLIAYEYDYIMNAVDYDEMILDLIQVGELDMKVLSEIKMKNKDDE